MVSELVVMSLNHVSTLPPTEKVKIPHVGSHLLRGILGLHVKGGVKIMVNELNSLFPKNLSFWNGS